MRLSSLPLASIDAPHPVAGGAERPFGGDGVAVGELVGDPVLLLDGTGRITYANAAAAGLLGAGSALTIVGEDAMHAFRRHGYGSAALALQAAVTTARARAPHAVSFTVHDPLGAPLTHWRVAARGTGALVVAHTPDVPNVADAIDMRWTAAPTDARDTDALGAIALGAIARALATLDGDVERALEQLAAGARALLAADGACVVLLGDENDDARIVAGVGSLGPLRGQRTELLDPPSPLHDAIVARHVVMSGLGERRHVVVAPLIVQDAVVAVLCAVTDRRGGFASRDAELAAQLAEHGALAVQNRRRYRAVERSARDARLLADVAQALVRHATPASLYPALAGIVRASLGACGVTVVLADPITRHVEQLYADGTGTDVCGALPPGAFWETTAGRVVHDGEARFVDGTVANAPMPDDRPVSHRRQGTAVRAVALLPLAADETRGLLAVHFPERHTFDDAERRLLVDFAAQVAAAVRNAALFATCERERDRAAAAAEIARLALDAATLDVGAAAILGVLDRLVPSSGKALRMLREADGMLLCAAATGTTAHLRGVGTRSAPASDDGPVIVPDLRAASVLREHAVAESAVLVPLVAHGRPLGDVVVTAPLGTRIDGPALNALRQLAAPIALALDALLLGEERRRRLGEERRMAEQLRQAEKMAALGELVAGVAHEINNPLTGVSAFAEMLLDDPLTDEQRESVRLIKREADRAVGVVRDLLAFSRKTEPTYEPLDLNALLDRTLRLRGYALRTAGIDVRMSVDPALPVVHGDAAKLQQVVLNLVLNAEYAMRGSSVRRLDATTRPTLGGVVLAIVDTGIGIAPDVLPRVFEPFFTTKPAGEGTGLGLSVSYGIVQAHGGELRVESTLGTGTTLEVILPTHPLAPGTLS